MDRNLFRYYSLFSEILLITNLMSRSQTNLTINGDESYCRILNTKCIRYLPSTEGRLVVKSAGAEVPAVILLSWLRCCYKRACTK